MAASCGAKSIQDNSRTILLVAKSVLRMNLFAFFLGLTVEINGLHCGKNSDANEIRLMNAVLVLGVGVYSYSLSIFASDKTFVRSL